MVVKKRLLNTKEKANSKYKNLTEEEKEAKKSIERIGIKKRKKMQKKILIYFYSIKISEKILKLNKKGFHAPKQAIALNLVDTNKIVVSDKFKRSGDGSKYYWLFT